MESNCQNKQTDKDRLKSWLLVQKMSQGKYVRTSEIIRWGVIGGYSNRADRNARELREEGFLRRLSSEETKRIWGKTEELGYEVVGDKPEIQEIEGQLCFS